MNRNLSLLSEYTFDIAIVGGGIYGAQLAREAALAGCHVALIEKSDFGGATSANSLKFVHGGLRYLQTLDLKRMRESIRERRTWLRIAPHLIRPIQVALPTYGLGIKSRGLMQAALAVNDIISIDRNVGVLPTNRIPWGTTAGKSTLTRIAPTLPAPQASGCAMFCDAQIYNSERLTMALLQSAVRDGAILANYVRADGVCRTAEGKLTITATDLISQTPLTIEAKRVIVAAGPWLDDILSTAPTQAAAPTTWAKGINLVLKRQLVDRYALGVYSRGSKQVRSVMGDRPRMLFAVPWRGRTMLGTDYRFYEGKPDDLRIHPDEIADFIDEFNGAWPGLDLTPADVAYAHCGLLPAVDRSEDALEPQLHKHYRITDGSKYGLEGLVAVTGVKYTTARDVAIATLNRACRGWGYSFGGRASDTTPVWGGDLDEHQMARWQARLVEQFDLEPAIANQYVANYGTGLADMIAYANTDAAVELSKTPAEQLLCAQVLFAVREEMATGLSDVVLRRTDLAALGPPPPRSVELCLELLRRELGWEDGRTEQEREHLATAMHRHLWSATD